MEIEIKIPVEIEIWKKLAKDVEPYSVHELKQDIYYSKYESREERVLRKEPTIRIRNIGIKQYLTLKKKAIRGSCENNEELESVITINPNTSKSAVVELLNVAGYKPYFYKKKESYRFLYEGVNCEVICVNDTYYYFEVEVVGNYDYYEAEGMLKAAVKKYGLDWENIDNRPWQEIIALEVEN